MKLGHPSETDIQQYAMGDATGDTGIITHINSCEHCRVRVANYKLLIAGIEQEPKPVFDFDATQLVLAQLSVSAEPVSRKKSFSYSMAFMVTVGIAVPGYFFRKFFINVASSISTFLLLTISAITILIILYRVMDMYRKYQKQLTTLNFH